MLSSTGVFDIAGLAGLVLLLIGVVVSILRYDPNKKERERWATELYQKRKSAGVTGEIASGGRTAIQTQDNRRMGRLNWLLVQLFGQSAAVVAGALVGTLATGVPIAALIDHFVSYDIIEAIVTLVMIAPTMAFFMGLGTLAGGIFAWWADVRRLHDMGKSGWNSLLRFSGAIPVIGWVVSLFYYLWLLFSAPDPNHNRWGPGPGGEQTVAVEESPPSWRKPPKEPDGPMVILRERLARGEISVEEFSQISSKLNETRDA